MLFEHQLETILEAYLSDEERRRIDAAIHDLQTYRDADFTHLPGGVNAGSHYLGNMLSNLQNLKSYGRTAADLAELERQKQASEQTQQVENTRLAAVKELCQRIEAKFPRFFQCLTGAPQFVQPNGQLVRELLSYRTMSREILAFLVRFFRTPHYRQLAQKVQELRDFGFNISAKLLNTDGGTFNTRYARISNVTLTYEGPIFAISDESAPGGKRKYVPYTTEEYIPGKAVLQIAGGKSIELENVGLKHIGEIIDTIDMVVRGSQDLGEINDVYLMGDSVVEYRLTVVDKLVKGDEGQYSYKEWAHLRGRELSIPSSEIRSPKDVATRMFQRSQQIRGYEQKPKAEPAKAEAESPTP